MAGSTDYLVTIGSRFVVKLRNLDIQINLEAWTKKRASTLFVLAAMSAVRAYLLDVHARAEQRACWNWTHIELECSVHAEALGMKKRLREKETPNIRGGGGRAHALADSLQNDGYAHLPRSQSIARLDRQQGLTVLSGGHATAAASTLRNPQPRRASLVLSDIQIYTHLFCDIDCFGLKV